jgi:hypothetical protein
VKTLVFTSLTTIVNAYRPSFMDVDTFPDIALIEIPGGTRLLSKLILHRSLVPVDTSVGCTPGSFAAM